jgi:hypothetical protein
VRRGDLRAAVEAAIGVAEIVGHEQDDVGLFRGVQQAADE